MRKIKTGKAIEREKESEQRKKKNYTGLTVIISLIHVYIGQ